MSALVTYESIYGNTRAVADAIADGLRNRFDAIAVPVHSVDGEAVDAASLLVVGGPTHMHGVASSTTRRMAVQAAADEGHETEPGAADDPGLREWLASLDGQGKRAAAFDTRIDKSPVLTGAASRGIAKRLGRRGFELVADPESFFVEDSEGPLADGELERARKWGESLAAQMGDKD